MANIYISFLGTNKYELCHYYAGDFKTPKPVTFVQEATISQNCMNWTSEDRIVIFATKDAKNKNWVDNGHCDPNTKKSISCEGLESRLKKLSLRVPFQNIEVDPGYTQEEIWRQFYSVFDTLKPEDHVVFDITHSFRSIPMLALVVIQYARIFKSVTLQGIYYGAFESLGAIKDVKNILPEKRNVLLVDLTPLAQLMDWTIATDRFLKSGDTRFMGELAQDSVDLILRNSRGKNTDAKAIKDMGSALKNLSLALSTCRGPEMSDAAGKLKQALIACRNLELLLPPFKNLFNHIEERMKPFSGSDLTDGLAAVQWCLHHGLIQQGFTLLEELLFTFVVKETSNNDMGAKILREIASQAFFITSNKYIDNSEKWDKPSSEHIDITRNMIDFIRSKGDLYKKFDRIRTLRNDLNHAGYNDNSKSVSDAWRFADELKKLHSEVERILSHAPTAPAL